MDKPSELALMVAGRLLGFSIRHNVPLGVALPPAIWAELLGQRASWSDYCLYDEEYRRHISSVLTLAQQYMRDGGVPGVGTEDPVAALYLRFSATEKDPVSGALSEVDLVPRGRDLEVHSGNIHAYAFLACRRRLLRGTDDRLQVMRTGLMSVIPNSLLSIFDASELSHVTAGSLSVDVRLWREGTVYDRPYHDKHPTIQHFWHVVQHDLTEPQRRKLLLFWSGISVPSSFGFTTSDLAGDEPWRIERAFVPYHASSFRDDWCPEAVTCDRILRLPEYHTQGALRKCLLIAIEHGGVGYDRA
uniref:HECT-type E3 ubiquitin transferase n=1 Tax=Rhizochromulina marina TaxID=1034831 RepID=A0A7S2RXL3_9STRA